MKPSSLTTAAALAFIGVGGFMAGRISSDNTTDAGNDGPAETRSSRHLSQSTGDSAAGSASRTKRAERGDRASSVSSSSVDHLATFTALMQSENPLDRNRALLAFIDSLSPDEFAEVVAQFRDSGLRDSRRGEYELLLSGWAKVDPLAALDFATENGARGSANTILTTWASIDPEAAIRWAEANHEGDGANPYLAGIIRSLAASDPARAEQLLTGMPVSRERAEALDAMLPHILTQGSDATRAWIASLTDDSLRNGAMLRAAERLAASDPAGTADWLLANPGEATQRRMDDVYSVWAQKDQQAALSSFATLPAGEARSNALRGVITSVASQDANAAVSMLNQYPNDVTDRVVQNVVWHSFGNDPSLAVSQISRIADERERNRTYDRILRTWTQRDPAAANAWIQANPLPPAVQDRLNR